MDAVKAIGLMLADLDVSTREVLRGSAYLREPKVKPRNRPPSAEAAMLRDETVRALVYGKALHPGWPVKCFIRVHRSYAARVTTEMDPARLADIRDDAAALAEVCGLE